MNPDLDELVTQLRTEKTDCLARARNFAEAAHKAETEAEMIAARIQGIEEGRAGERAAIEQASGAASTRQPRRDIRGLVRKMLTDEPRLRTIPRDQVVSHMAKFIMCRPSQVEAALRSVGHPTDIREALADVPRPDGAGA